MPERGVHRNISELPSELPRVPAAFFARQAGAVARALLGCYVVRLAGGVVMSGRIVETEAYVGPQDEASHAYNGRRTPRNEQMYAAPGTAYIYFTYGMHYCCNVSVLREGYPAAVLLRALEPVEGIDELVRRRGCKVTPPEHKLLSGPGNLCKAFELDRSLDGEDLLTSDHFFITSDRKVGRRRGVVATPRVGIGERGEWTEKPLRFFIADHPSVSGPKRVSVGKARVQPTV
jgi:DNA-3-methyladenine glycosylase